VLSPDCIIDDMSAAITDIMEKYGWFCFFLWFNDVRIAELLEPSKGKNHPVRSCLGLSPENRVKRAIEQLLIELGVKVRES